MSFISRYKKYILMFSAFIVIGITVYALLIPAFTLENNTEKVIENVTEKSTEVMTTEVKEENTEIATVEVTEEFVEIMAEKVTENITEEVTEEKNNNFDLFGLFKNKEDVKQESNKKATEKPTQAPTSAPTQAPTSAESSEETTLTQEKTNDYKVAVKGNKSILENCDLVVEEISPEKNTDYYSAMVKDINSNLSSDINKKSEIFDFIKMYHIYLSKNGKEYVLNENQNVNLHVTITYNSLDSNSLYVGHYGTGAVKKSFSNANGDSTSLGIQKISVHNNSITFHLKSFSVITTASLSANAESQTTDSSSILSKITQNDANNWQITNIGDTTYEYYEDNMRIQKRLIPTGVQNEFYVYMNVEPEMKSEKIIFQETFATSGVMITNNNNSANYTSMSEAENNEKKWSYLVDGEYSGDDYFKGTTKLNEVKRIVLDKGNGDTVTLENVNMKYKIQSQGTSSMVFSLRGESGVYKVPSCVETFDSGTGTLTFNAKTYTALKEAGLYSEGGEVNSKYKVPISKATKITDKIDIDHFEYLGYVVTSENNADVTFSNDTLIWKPSDYSDKGEVNGENNYEDRTYKKNAYEIVYKIRLKTEVAGFTPNTSYNTSKSSFVEGELLLDDDVLKNKSFTKYFAETAVKGELYTFNVNKIDKTNNDKLSNAVFKLSGRIKGITNSGTCGVIKINNESIYVNFDNSGNINIESENIKTGLEGQLSITGLPYGSYTLIETQAPEGYKQPENCTMTYDFQHNSSGITSQNWTCENEPDTPESVEVTVNMIKTGDGDITNPLKGAEFSLKCTDGDNKDNYYSVYTAGGINNVVWVESSNYRIVSGSNGKFSVKLTNGTYTLTETKSPNGYYSTDSWIIEIKDNVIKKFTTSNGVNIDCEDSVYNISNSSGKLLPNTGGTGTNICIIGGVLIIAHTLLWGYIIRRKRKN